MGERIDVVRKRVKEAFSDYTELAGGKNYRFYHSVRVMRLSLRLVGVLGTDVDREVVAAGALLHDIGRVEDIEDGYLDPMSTDENHAERGVKFVADYAGDVFSGDEIEVIKSIVAKHDSEPENEEGRIVRDADMLDVYGVSNLWRMFNYSFEKGRSFEDEEEYFRENAVPEMRKGLEKFSYDLSRRVARRRLEKHVDAVEQMIMENHGVDISRSI